MLNITTNKGNMERLERINEISVGSFDLGNPMPEEEHSCSEYAACKILKAERMLDVRQRMLIGMQYLKAGESVAI